LNKKQKIVGVKMKKITISFITLIGLFLLMFSGSGCSSKHTPAAVAGSDISVPIQSQACEPKKGNNIFAGNFYDQCKAGTDGNVLFSPFSIFSALSMTYEGAKNNTAAQMASVLRLQTDNATRWAGFSSMMSAINASGRAYTLNTSNNLWLEKNFSLNAGYTAILTTDYLAAITLLDFVNDPAGSCQTINNAVASQTNNKITNLVPSSDITPETSLVLTNAIYMKADWASKFPAEETVTSIFYKTAVTPVQVSMMAQTMGGKIEDYYGKAQVMELPYVNNELSMFVFLPPQGQMTDLESVMTGDRINSWFADRVSGAPLTSTVKVYLPKFTFSTSYNLVPMLRNMGMTDAFSKTLADFSGMAPITDTRLYISDVVHKAFVAINENGTEAAAATAVIIGRTSAVITQTVFPPEFMVNHPFIFVIRENTTNAILFVGRVMDPGVN
jgi:serpin B